MKSKKCQHQYFYRNGVINIIGNLAAEK